MTKNKDKSFWGVLGAILLVMGFIGSIGAFVREEEYIWMILTGSLVIVGILLIAWALKY